MADVELQEQSIPLKSGEPVEGAETVAGAEGGQQTATVVEQHKVVVKEKKGWFAKKKTAKNNDVAATGEEKAGVESGADGEGGANNVSEKKGEKHKGGGAKKCPFSFCRSQKCGNAEAGHQEGAQSGGEHHQPSFQFNMVQRDDRKLQEAIDLDVQNIFGEPDAVHSLNGVWKTTLSVFLAVRNFIYKFLSLLLAIPLAIVFGILFALLSALSVFVFVPIGRLLSIPFGWLAKVWSVVIGAVFDPICHSCGLLFGNIKISRYGINQDPTAVITA